MSLLLLLTLTSACAWTRFDAAAYILGTGALGAALWSGRVNAMGVLALLTFLGLHKLYLWRDSFMPPMQRVCSMLHVTLGTLLFLHWVPGFHPWRWLPPTRFHADAAVFVTYLHIDKILVGSLLLMTRVGPTLADGRALAAALRRALWPVLCTIAALMLPAYGAGYVRFEPQLHPLLWLWAAHNLLLVMLHEEVMFRHVLPQALEEARARYAMTPRAMLAMTSLMFGAYHYKGGLTYVLLAAGAGVGYGWACRNAGRLEGSMMAHFLLNTVHFVAFTYPRLIRPQ